MSKTFWIRMATLLPAAVTLHLVLHGTTDLVPDVGAVGAFVTAIGTLYSVLAGFTVISVWTEFTDTDRAIKREARELSELYRYVGYVSDTEGVTRARAAIVHYRDEVLTTEWGAMMAGGSVTAAEDEFLSMADAVNAIDVVTPKDVPAWAEAVRTLGAVSDARGDRILLVTLRMPGLLAEFAECRQGQDGFQRQVGIVSEVAGEVVGAKLVLRIEALAFQVGGPLGKNRPIVRGIRGVSLSRGNAGHHQDHVAALFDGHLVFLGLLTAAIDLPVRERVRAQIVRREIERPALGAGVFH